MYEIYLERAAERELKQIPKEDFNRIILHIKTLAENPRPRGCCKLSGSATDWRIRVGVYRIIYEIDEKAKAVRVMRVRHRRESYR
ncbi:MAG: type II toxin-antitoxin system RelE/ParE family toxin [Candidatus Schekmanbacteria bacterium]|nr:type II toxin-antitoxin system RelE/ParE family toxin [Candidatus Schekmanbacteria bacterium]